MKVKSIVLILMLFLVVFTVTAVVSTVEIGSSSPTNQSWSNQNIQEFYYNATSTINTTFTCELFVNNVGYGRNITYQNNTLSNFTTNATLSQGALNWYVNCTDVNNTLMGPVSIINIDTTNPVPTINSPANNSWTSDASPELLFNISDNLDSQINYTIFLDGESNSTSNTANNTITSYNGSLTNGTYTFVLEALDEATNRVNSSILTLNVDTANPTSTITSPNNDTWTTDGTPEIFVNLTDNLDALLNYTVFVDEVLNAVGSAQNSSSVSINLTVSNGTHSIVVEARDEAGNRLNSTILTLNIDDTLPVSTINSPANNSWSSDATPDVNFTLTDNVDLNLNYTIFIDDVANLTGNLSNNSATVVTLGTLSTGTHTLVIETFDDAGNRANSSILTLNIDTTNPSSTVNSPANDTWTTDTTPDINFTLVDNLDINLNYTFFVDGVANLTGNTSNNTATVITMDALSSGIHTLVVETYDDAGNRVNSSILTINVDNVDPSSTINSPANNSWITDTTPDVNFTLTDNVDLNLNYTLFVDGVANVTGNVSNNSATVVTLGTLSVGTHTLVVETFDEAGNRANSSITILNIDTVNPSSTINSPTNNSWTTDTTPDLNFTLIDNLDINLNYTLFVDGVANLTGNVTNNTPIVVTMDALTAGTHTVVVEVFDDADNRVNSSILTLNVDNVNPTSVITSPTNNSWTNDTTPEILFNVSDYLDSTLNYSVFINEVLNTTGVVSSGGITSYNFSTLIEGTYSVVVETYDEAGNRVNSSILTLNIDTTDPNISLTYPVDYANISASTVTLNFSSFDNLDTILNYTVYVNSVSNTSGVTLGNNTATNLTLTAGNGVFTWFVQVMDETGNTMNSSTRTFTIDTANPTVTHNTPANGSIFSNATVIVNFTVSDTTDETVNYNFFINEVLNSSGTLTNSTTTSSTQLLTDGVYNWTIEATDDFGNVLNSTSYFTVDTTAPLTSPTLDSSGVNDTDSDGNVEIGWSPDSNANSYNVYRALYNITNATGLTMITNTTGTSFEDNTTSNGTTYYYVITSVDTAGNENASQISSSISVLANDSIAPKNPTNANASTNANGSVALSWNAVLLDVQDNADTNVTYRVYRSDNISGLNNVSSMTNIVNTTDLSYEDTSMTTGINYSYVIIALDDGNNENISITTDNVKNISPIACTTTFTSWTSCSNGIQTRTRTCYGGGNQTENTTCSTSSSSSSSSSSSARRSSSSSGSTVVRNPKATQTFSTIASGEKAVMKIANSNIGVTEITLAVKNEVSNVQVNVEKLSERPASTKETSRKVYQYLSLEKVNLDNGDIRGKADVTFKVEKSWLAEQGISEENVVLLRHTDDWDELETKVTSSDDVYVYFSAQTPGFSYFAIAEKEIEIIEPVVEQPSEEIIEQEEIPPVPQEKPQEQEVKEEPVEQEYEEEKPDSKIASLVVLLVLLAVVVIVGYFSRKDPIVEEPEKHHKKSHKRHDKKK